jgi:hypothetical protein
MAAEIEKLASNIIRELYGGRRRIVWGLEEPRYSALVDRLIAHHEERSDRGYFDFVQLMAMDDDELFDLVHGVMMPLRAMFVYNFDVCGEGTDFYRATDVMSSLRASNNSSMDQSSLMLARPKANLNYWRPVASRKPTDEDGIDYTWNHPLGNWAEFRHVNGDELEFRSTYKTFS